MGKKVLTVDDASSMRLMIKSCLKHEGYDVFTAKDGVDALNKVKQGIIKFDLIISDVNMPNMDGITFVKELNKLDEYKYTPVIMLTTESQMAKKIEAEKSGAIGWIVKPFEPDDFIYMIKSECFRIVQFN